MTVEEAKDVLRNTAWMGTDNGTKVFEAIKITTEALEKAEKYRWHDLRKNQDELPAGNVMVYIAHRDGYGNYMIAYNYDGLWFEAEHDECFDRYFDMDYWSVVAWKEIEEFEEES